MLNSYGFKTFFWVSDFFQKLNDFAEKLGFIRFHDGFSAILTWIGRIGNGIGADE